MQSLVASLAIGIVLPQIARRVLEPLGLGHRLKAIYAKIRALRALENDEQRQRLLLAAGRETLQSSCCVLALSLLLLAIALLPPCTAQWDRSQQLLYFIGLSIVAPGWWALTRQRSTANHVPK